MSDTSKTCFDQNCDSEQLLPNKQDCLPRCELGSYGYIEQLKLVVKDDCRVVCLEELSRYLKNIPAAYDSYLYDKKASVSKEILINIKDDEFIKLATSTLHYILFDNFHETLRYGEDHLDRRFYLALRLFNNAEETVKDIGATALLRYAKDVEVPFNKQLDCIRDLMIPTKYRPMGLEGLKSVIQNMESFDSSFIIYFGSQPYTPRNVEDVKFWADVLGEVAKDSAVRCEARAYTYKQLVDYRNYHSVENGVFGECRKNKVCIKDITESLEYVDNWISGLTKLADYPFVCDDGN